MFTENVKSKSDADLRITFLGGLNEIGKNMTVFETKKDIIIVDMGLQFPTDDMHGIDFVIPDTAYLMKKKSKIRGLIFTHGHLDHIGAIGYLYEDLNIPVAYGTDLTLALAKARLKELRIKEKNVNLQLINKNSKLKLGDFFIEFFHVNHSIPGGLGLSIETKDKKIIHTGDFKFDMNPHDGKPADFSRIALLANTKKTKILLSDSTNSKKKGYTISEKKVSENLMEFIEKADGRIIIASFSSLIGRIQKIAEAAIKYNKTIFVTGRSMIQNIKIAKQLGLLKAPNTQFLELNKNINNIKDDKIIVLTTGSQGEELSALTRMAGGEHQILKIKFGDNVLMSSSPIIGNERAIVSVINKLCKSGAKVFTNDNMDIHASGHGSREDLKLMISLVRPDFFIPIHGEYYHRKIHSEIADSLGMANKNVFLLENGMWIDFLESKCLGYKKSEKKYENIMIDGVSVGNEDVEALRDREMMGDSGVVLIIYKPKTIPIILSRGFVLVKDKKRFMDDIRDIAKKSFDESDNIKKEFQRKFFIRKKVSRFILKKMNKEPLVMPVFLK